MTRPASKRLAWWLCCLADRIDYEGAPQGLSYSFTIEDGEGIRFRDDGRGALCGASGAPTTSGRTPRRTGPPCGWTGKRSP